MVIRDRVLAGILDIYIHQGQNFESNMSGVSTQSQQQCFINQYADDALETLVLKSEVNFITNSLSPLLRVEQPPRLQALLKAITSRIKASPERIDLEIRQAESNK